MSTCGLNDDLVRIDECVSPTEGTEDRGFIANFKDVVRWTKGNNAPSKVASIIFNGVKMKFTKRFFKIEGRNNSINGLNSFDGTGMLGKYTHGLNFTAYSDKPEIAAALRELNSGKAVAVIQTKNQEFKIAGRESGLITQEANQDISLADNGGTYNIVMQGVAGQYMEYLKVYTGTLPNVAEDFPLSASAFDSLQEKTAWAITGITVGATTRIVLDDTVDNPYVHEAEVGTLVSFADIVGTVGTDGTNGLNGKSFAIASIIDKKTFTITANTTGLVYTSGGTAK